jgi:hypothetical protein
LIKRQSNKADLHLCSHLGGFNTAEFKTRLTAGLEF